MDSSKTKIDLKKELAKFYKASSKKVDEIYVPRFQYLMIDGQGDPNTTAFYAQAVEALFSVSYTVKFTFKKSPDGKDYAVMPLEGLWWAKDMSAFTSGDKSQWLWTMMIMQPDFISKDLLKQAIASVKLKKNNPALEQLRIEHFEEGACAQTLHVGPFTEEGPTITKVHAFINAKSSLRGKHHEIYLSDIRRAAPEKWRTIIRQPMTL